MILPIDEQYRIAADNHCWAIQELIKRKDRKTGRPTTEWKPIRWYGSIEQTINSLARLMLRTSDAQTLKDALTEVDRIAATLGNALTPQFDVTLRRAS